jgi:ACT domain-containing protein
MPEDATREAEQAYTVRLELVDEPGELLAALEPIAEHGGNLLSIFHQRGSLTPRGHVPVEVDVECHPDQFEVIVGALREAGINVIQAGAERYSDHVTVLLTGPLIETDLSETLHTIEAKADASVTDIALAASEGTEDSASARLRLATDTEHVDEALAAVRAVAETKGFQVVEPLTDGQEGAA